ncbi:MAG: hypothetical protein J6Q85_04440 [Clostridia bacterium]|nr:hypothetical protein [Clostridia bacterium]
MTKNNNRVRLGCYAAGVTMSVIANLSPILFLTFHSIYGISYSLLGLLVLVNFSTQLIVDLLFSLFPHKFNISISVKLTPILAVSGLLIYALSPFVFYENAFVGILIGTVIFSAAGGLAEVLISPVIAAIPSKNPDREMSKLHSAYAWGTVGVVTFSTLFLLIFDREYWWVLSLVFLIIPLISALHLLPAQIPELKTQSDTSQNAKRKYSGLGLLFLAIFLGGAAECTMSQWSSSYIESALGINKTVGDILGVAVFAITLGLGRTLYAKYGRNICRVLVFGSVGAFICYITAAVSSFSWLGLIACALTGLCTSMLWPGTLIVAEKRFAGAGVFIFALMAAGGDLGASLVPQLVGVVADLVASLDSLSPLATALNITRDSLGMRAGMLSASLFPLAAIAIFLYIFKMWKIDEKKDENFD